MIKTINIITTSFLLPFFFFHIDGAISIVDNDWTAMGYHWSTQVHTVLVDSGLQCFLVIVQWARSLLWSGIFIGLDIGNNNNRTFSDSHNFHSASIDSKESTDICEESGGTIVGVEVRDWDIESSSEPNVACQFNLNLAIIFSIDNKLDNSFLVMIDVCTAFSTVRAEVFRISISDWDRLHKSFSISINDSGFWINFDWVRGISGILMIA